MGSFFPQQYSNYNSSDRHNSYFPCPQKSHRLNTQHKSHGGNRTSQQRVVDSAMDDDFNPAGAGPGMNDPNFDILEWHPAYLSCQRYFLDHAQYEPGTQAVCALINIRLPFQWLDTPITASASSPSAPPTGQGSNFNFNHYPRAGGSNMNSPRSRSNDNSPTQYFVSPVPYIRRLIVTGFDKAAILHGFFGDDYVKGVMPHVECERRNYLFAAKHGGWRSCKKQYDIGSGHGADETVPFLKPLDQAKAAELNAAETTWSDWLAMEDWMVGPRAPRDESSRQERYRGGTTRPGVPDASLIDGVPEGYRSR